MLGVGNVTSASFPDLKQMRFFALMNLCRVVLHAEDLQLQRAMREYAEVLSETFETAA